MEPSHTLKPDDFDLITSVNYRGTWLSAREELKRMITQEPLPTHDGRPGNRGVIVNIASNLGLVSRNATRGSILALIKVGW
jgi:NAD(P)-dependent dehydrogenase (short-subunit alcohol dehydrogenase family)